MDKYQATLSLVRGVGLGKWALLGCAGPGQTGVGGTHTTNLRKGEKEAYTIPPCKGATARMPLTVLGACLQMQNPECQCPRTWWARKRLDGFFYRLCPAVVWAN
jgi:hypothetical protein